MRRPILSLLLTACLLFSLVPFSAAPVRAAETTVQKVVYIPLDDRPFNDSRVKTMAESLNIQLIMPEQELYATRLDGQTKNSNGTQYGSREELFAWLQEMDKDYDTFIISLDQLLSGGLMNSRCMTEMTALTFADGSSMTEYEVIDFLAQLAQDNTLYLIDSVTRLACSSDFGGFTLSHYGVTRAYGMVGRPVFYGEELTIEDIIAAYPYTADGVSKAYKNLSAQELAVLLSPRDATQNLAASSLVTSAFLQHEEFPLEGSQESALVEAPSETDASLLSEYLAIRARKLRLTDYAMRTLCGRKNVHYLLGVDDSSDGNNIQRNEIALFEQYITENDQLFSALDGLGQTALSRVFLDACPMDSLKVSVSYFGDEAHKVLSYNCFTVSEILDNTLAYYGAQHVEQDADLSLVVVTTAYENSDWMLNQLVSTLNENEYHQIPTILIDLTNFSEPELNTMLVENTHLGMLLSFSGGGELPNGIVMGISQGIARYHALELSGFQTQATQQAHLENLAASLVKEIGYWDGASASMREYLTGRNISPSNFQSIDERTQIALNHALTDSVQKHSAALLANLSQSSFITSLSPYTTGGIQSVSIGACEYPWLRQMEIECAPTVVWSDKAHTGQVFHSRYIDGTSQTTFEPDAAVTREQTAKLLITALGLSQAQEPGQQPGDVSDWAWPYVSAAVQKGYMKGYPDGTLGGENSIIRAEFAALLMQYVQAEHILLPSTKSVTFSDVPDDDSDWYNQYVYALARAGIIQGDTEGTFRPNDSISRAEAVTLLNRLTGRTEELSSSLLRHIRFSDVTVDWHIPMIQEGSVSHFS